MNVVENHLEKKHELKQQQHPRYSNWIQMRNLIGKLQDLRGYDKAHFIREKQIDLEES